MLESTSQTLIDAQPSPQPRESRLWDVLLILVLFIGAYFRFTGINWGEGQFLHPDERFFIWVTADISPVNSISEYFNTETSSLNPHNRGHGFYVYGTLPVFMTRYLANSVIENPSWEDINLIGRILSASLDLLTVFLVQ